MDQHIDLPPNEAFIEMPGMRGLRIARLGQADGRTLEIVEAVKGVIIPAMTHPGLEKGRVLEGSLHFFVEGSMRELKKGDVWEVPAGQHQGPHVVQEDGTKVAILRDGDSSHDMYSGIHVG
ncbi:MAG: cupin domain-containing protein [Deltaproteobacteria bacterium]|nr:cupin domain-containing protein [Deltaproteobacteria bacterium]